MQWHGHHNGIRIQGFWLEDPFTYVDNSARPQEPSALNDALEVKAHPFLVPLGYWPSYAGMNAAQRHEYLGWLASGRHELPSELGYVFVYFYGLERRALIDGLDHKFVFSEVMRLRALHVNGAAKISQSFLSYSGSLLWLLLARSPGDFSPEQVRDLVLSPERWNAARAHAALAWCAHYYEKLPLILAFTLAGASSQSSGGCHLGPIQNELRQLFVLKYQERFKDGIGLRAQSGERKVQRAVQHFSASSVLGNFQINASLAEKTLAQIELLGGLWDECTRELWSLASLISRKSELSAAERWEATPPVLRRGPHPYTAGVMARVQADLERQQFAPVNAGVLAGDCRIRDLTGRARWTKNQCLALGQTLEGCGLAIEPDFRITGKAYTETDTVVLFAQPEESVDPRKYQAAALMLRLGLLAAAADGKVDKVELDVIAKHVQEVFALNRAEQKRLRALAGLLMGTKLETVTAKATLDLLSAPQRKSVARLLLAVVAADGVIHPAEMKHLKSCFTRLGLGEKLLDSLVNQLKADDVVEIIAGTRSKTAGEKIPPPPAAAAEKPLQLDKAAIEALLGETQRVQASLIEAMVAQDEKERAEVVAKEPEPVEVPPLETATEPPERYRAFYRQLIDRTVWPEAEANALAKEHGQMLSGALEALNDWAIEQGGSPIFYDEGGEIVVELETVSWAE